MIKLWCHNFWQILRQRSGYRIEGRRKSWELIDIGHLAGVMIAF